MKTTSVFVLATLALASCSIDRATAAQCTMDDIATVAALSMELLDEPSCTTVSSTNSNCPDAKCLPTLEKIASKMPDCSTDNENLKTTFGQLVKTCSSKSASSTFTLSAGVAAASAVAAVAVAFL